MLRLTTLPPPVNNFQRRCIDWGSCGICAMAAKNSILLYSINMTNNLISLLKVIEFSPCDIFSLKFHNDEPILAVSRSTGLLVYDCQKGQTRSGLKIEDLPGNLIQLEWCGDILICLSKRNIILAIKIIPFEHEQTQFSSSSFRRDSYISSDFPKCRVLWKIEMKGEFNGISIDHFHRCRILAYSNNSSISLYQSDSPQTAPHFLFSYQFSKPILDAQFHPQVADIIFILTTTSTILSFEIQTKSVFFVIQEFNSVMRFEQFILPLHSYKNLFVICSDSTIIYYETTDKVQFHKKYWSSSIIKSQHFKSINTGKFVSGRCFLLCNPLLDGIYLLYSKPLGLALIKSNFLLHKNKINNNDLNRNNEYDDIFFKQKNVFDYYISLNKNTPHSTNSFDCCDNYIGYGTNKGEIFIIDVIKANIKYHFNFQDKIVKFLFIDSNSFIWTSIPKKANTKGSNSNFFNTSNSTSSKETFDSLDNPPINQMFNAGYFNINERTWIKFKNVTDIFSNRKYGIIQHGGFYFEIILKKDSTSSTSVSNIDIRKMYLQTEVSTCALQIEEEIQLQSSSSFNDLLKEFNNDTSVNERHRAGSTLLRQVPKQISILASNLVEDDEASSSSSSFDSENSDNTPSKKGEKIAFITSSNQNIVIYDIATDKYIRKLQCPKEFKNSKIIKVSFTRNLIILTSLDSKICLVNLKLSSSRIITTQFVGIKKISFQERGSKFAILSIDNKFVVYDGESINVDNPSCFCNSFINDFSTCSRKMFVVQIASRELKFISEDLLLPIKQNPSNDYYLIPSKEDRLNNLISSIQNIEQKDNYSLIAFDFSFIFACNFFQFESLLWTIVDKYFQSIDNEPIEKNKEIEGNKKMLQLKYYQYGDEKEYQSLTTFRSSLIQNNSTSYEACCYQLLNAIRCHDVAKMREAILSSNTNLFGVIAAALIDSKISENACSFLDQTAMEYFDKGKNLEATIIMELINNRLGAAAVLQSKNMWNASLEILVTLKKSEDARELIKNAAYHYLSINETKKAILLFVSIGDFYPALSILKMADMDVFAYFLLKFIEKRTEIQTCSLSRQNEYHFESLDSLKESIVNDYNDFIKLML